MPEMSLGDRIAQIRRRRSMTQEELADRAGISADVIRKLEQNRRASTAIRTLHAIARGLEIETSELLRDGAELDHDDNGDAAILLTLRRILMPAPGLADDSDPPDREWLRTAVVSATREYRASHYRVALGQFAELLRRASTRTDDEGTARILSAAYLVTGRTLIQLRHEDLAYESVRRSMHLATAVDDSVLHASAADALIWILIRQARFGEAERSALHFAAMVETPITSADPASMAAFGQLCIQAAASAARNNRPTHSADHLSMARAAAVRIGGTVESLVPYRTAFGPDVVSAIEVESAMVAGDAEHALALADAMPPGANLRQAGRRHLLTVAEAQTSLRQYSAAVSTLNHVKAISSEWLTTQRLARHIVRDLLDSQGVRWARNSGIADLASEMKIAV